MLDQNYGDECIDIVGRLMVTLGVVNHKSVVPCVASLVRENGRLYDKIEHGCVNLDCEKCDG